MGRLAGKVAIITGASRGIGAGIARAFAREDARVTLAARSVEKLEAVAAEILAAGGEALVQPTDIAVSDDLRRMVEATVEAFGGLDILVNNGAIASFSRMLDAEDLEVEYDRLMDTNLKSLFMGIHWALPHWKVRGGGSVVNISSVHGTATGSRMSAYAASKGAMNAGTKAIAIELAPELVRVNCISPGTIWNEPPGDWLQRRLGPELWAEFVEQFGDWPVRMRTMKQPLPVAGTPEDVAYCAIYLASDESRFVTGANFHVDGGMTCVLGDPSYWHAPGLQSIEQGRVVRDWVQAAMARKEQPAP
jgi:NAD(P)-dependent dehydrogenase (short-subunit alcohol dehydrogenase family)